MKAMNKKAQKINKALGVIVWNESVLDCLVVLNLTKKQIKDQCIDDLIRIDGQKCTATIRLRRLSDEILAKGSI